MRAFFVRVGLVFLGFFAVSVHAETIPATYTTIAPTTGYRAARDSSDCAYTGSGYYSTPESACVADYVTYCPAYYGYSHTVPVSSSQFGCVVFLNTTKTTTTTYLHTIVQNVCPTAEGYTLVDGMCRSPLSCPATGGWSLSGANCVRPDCDVGETRDETTGECLPSQCPDAGAPAGGGGLFPANSGHSPLVKVGCSGGCTTLFVGQCPTHSRIVEGVRQIYCTGSYEYAGGTVGDCVEGPENVAPPPLLAPPENSCAPGQLGGEVNGKLYCYTPEGDPVDPAPAAPKVTDTKVDDVVNPDGSVDRTVTKTDPDGNQTVTQEHYPAGTAPPAVPSQSSTTEPQSDQDAQDAFCEENPNTPLCKESAWQGGKDLTGFGDVSGEELQARQNFEAAITQIKEQAQQVLSVQLQTGAGSLPCWSDAPITIGGHEVSVCMTSMEEELRPIGAFVVLIATLVVGMMILRT